MKSFIFTTERLGFRAWKDSDLRPFSDMNQDRDVMEYFPSILNPEESAERVNKINKDFQDLGYGLYAVEQLVSHEFIGFIGFSHPSFELHFTPCVEIGWRINKVNWGKGFATEGAKKCLEYGFSRLEFREIYSWTSIHNLKSERVMKKIGLKKIGEFDHPLISEQSQLKKHVLYKGVKDESI